MKEIIAELLNNGNVILYNTDLLDDLIKELNNRNISYKSEKYGELIYFTNKN